MSDVLGDVSYSERIYINYRQKGWEKLSGASSGMGPELARKKHPLLWVSCGWQTEKLICN